MKVLQYAVCINSFAAWKAITEEEPGVDLMTPRMFGQRTEAEAWMRSQKHPEYFTIVPAVSIREAAYTGANYSRRPIPPQAFNFARHDLGTPTPLVDWADA